MMTHTRGDHAAMDEAAIDEAAIDEAITRIKKGAITFVHEEALRAKLRTKRPLLVKLGADPSAPDIHLGHVVVLKKLRLFQDLGHQVCFVIGDFTARIGDPTGRSKTRPALSEKQILSNAKTYEAQVYKILDPKRTKIVFNSTWSKKLDFEAVLQLTAKTTVAQLIERDDFMKRYKAGQPISLVEFFYPIMQAFDSVELRADVELGGSDQTFNLLFARNFQREYKQDPQVIITMPLLVGLDGRDKMSKSLGNYIAITDPPREMFGKIMSLPDGLILAYFTQLTDRHEEEIASFKQEMTNGANPRDFKEKLALDLITSFHDAKSAAASAKEFARIFQSGGLPDESAIKVLSIPEKYNAIQALRMTELFTSNGEVRRLIKGRGLKIAGKPIVSETAILSFADGDILQVGKRHFFRLHRG